MFDISFSELFVIGIVALLVIGPEKLPKVARTVGAFIGRLQRYTAQIKDEVNREMRFEELQRLQQEIQQHAVGFESSIMAPIQEVAETISESSSTATDLTTFDDVVTPSNAKPKRKPRKSKQETEQLNDSATRVSARKAPIKKSLTG